MAELDLLRSLPFPIAEPSDEARARARERLLRHVRRSGLARRRRLLVPAVGLAAAGAVAALVGVGLRDQGNATAATVLRDAASIAISQAPPPALEPGQFRYTKSVQAYTVTAADKGFWTALGPTVREIWLGPTGGLLRETSGKPQFLSTRDRERWIADGRPMINAPKSSTPLPPQERIDLPTDPDVLYARLGFEAVGHGNGIRGEMFTLVGDALRETDASPELRAALYEVAARIPGVELVGPATDREGRHGLAVAYSSSANRQRHELIFDPETAALLEEEYIVLAGNSFGYRPGTVIGYATYVEGGVVDKLGARP